MNKSQKILISIAVLGICLLQIVIIGIRLYTSDAYSHNPLIPDGLYKPIRNFNYTLIGLHCFAALFNVFYLLTKKYFWATLTLSLLILLVLALFKVEIHNWFFTKSGFTIQ